MGGAVVSEIGYTEKQANRLHHRIDLNVAKAEDAVAALRGLLSDVDASRFTQNLNLDSCLDEVRNVAEGLHDTVDRRKR